MNRGMGTGCTYTMKYNCDAVATAAHTTHRNSTIGTFQWRNEIRIYKYFAYVNYDIVFRLGSVAGAMLGTVKLFASLHSIITSNAYFDALPRVWTCRLDWDRLVHFRCERATKKTAELFFVRRTTTLNCNNLVHRHDAYANR